MAASVYHRETCRLCDSKNLELVVKLDPIPLSENYATDSETGKSAARYPIDLYMCTDCGHVHQLDIIDSVSLWEDYTYFSGDAKGMPEHFQNVANEVMADYQFPEGSLVVDVGSNDGSLLKPFKAKGCRVLGIDPATEVARQASEAGIPTIPALMSVELAEQIKKDHGQADVICTFNAFAHADNLGEMVDAIRTILAPDGVFVFEVQYLLDIIDGTLVATIFHEHMSHHSVKPMVQFLDKHGLELISVARAPIQHGSLIGRVQHKGGKRPVDNTVADMLALEVDRRLSEVDTLLAFNDKLNDQKVRMSQQAAAWKEAGVTIAGFGAARSGPTLISQLGLTGSIQYIVDDHPQKVGRYSSGDGIPIVPTAELCAKMPNYTVILAWVHSKKIIENNQEYLDKGGKFVVLCPEMRIVTKDGDIAI